MVLGHISNGAVVVDGPLLFPDGAQVRIELTQANPASAESSRDHSAFLSSYAPEDEGLYDDYPAG